MAFTGDLSQLWSDDEAPPPKLLDVLSQIAHFLDQLGYTKTFASLYKEAKKNGLILDIAEWERGIQAKTAIPLLDLYEEWYEANDKFPTLPDSEDEDAGTADDSSDDDSESEEASERDEAEGVLVDVEAEETSDDDSDEDSDSDESTATPTKTGVKRKRVATPSSSEDSSSDDSSSDSDDSSSDDSGAPPAKKTKVEKSASSASDSDSSDSDSSSDSSSSSSSSDSDSESDESSSSESESDRSDSEDDAKTKTKSAAVEKKKKKKKNKKGIESIKTNVSSTQSKDAGSLSSATLEGESAGEKENDSGESSHIHPDRLKQMPASRKEAAAEAKKQQVPFSRIPNNQKVDPRFASNEYVSYDYADRAYRDLSVTKGKGFTKEKNKKKRGAYRGGMIDMAPKGIKFDD